MLEPEYHILANDNIYDKNGKLKVVDINKTTLIYNFNDSNIVLYDNNICLYDRKSNTLMYTFQHSFSFFYFYKTKDYIISYINGSITIIDNDGISHIINDIDIKLIWGYFTLINNIITLIGKYKIGVFYEIQFIPSVQNIFSINYTIHKYENMIFMYYINNEKKVFIDKNLNLYENDKLILKDCINFEYHSNINIFILKTPSKFYKYYPITSILIELKIKDSININNFLISITNNYLYWNDKKHILYLYDDNFKNIKNIKCINYPIILEPDKELKSKYNKLVDTVLKNFSDIIPDLINIVKTYLYI